MNFFEQIGERISNAGQETATKAKNFAEITKLNNRIDEAEKQITKLLLEIGRSYYEDHKTDDDQKIVAVNNWYLEIAKCKEKIQEYKGIEVCVVCGAQVVAGAAFCNACGAKIIPVAVEKTANICPNCHAVINEGAIFCTSCGNKLV